MNVGNLKVDLEARLDKNDKLWHLGKIKFPGTIDLSQGITVLVFLSEDGDEELQIAVNNKDNSTFNKVKREKVNDEKTRLKISIDPRQDQYDKTFFVCKVRCDVKLNCSEEVVFLVYTSKPGYEELQVVGNLTRVARKITNDNIEIINCK